MHESSPASQLRKITQKKKDPRAGGGLWILNIDGLAAARKGVRPL
jgi:hypothetical protein